MSLVEPRRAAAELWGKSMYQDEVKYVRTWYVCVVKLKRPSIIMFLLTRRFLPTQSGSALRFGNLLVNSSICLFMLSGREKGGSIYLL